MILGAHTPFTKTDGYLVGSYNFSKQIGANAMMIYLGAPQNSRRADTSEYQLEEYKKISDIDPINIVVHAPYIVNPASLEKYQFAIDFLIKDIERINYFGGKYMVLHPGAHTKFDRKESLEKLVYSLKAIIAKTDNVEILLETMAGKGSELGTTFEELRWIIDQVDSPRVGICLDTCHVWESGYDITNLPEFLKEMKKYDLLELSKVIHVNDSKNLLGAKKDRHENIGKGHIGTKALKDLIHAPEFNNSIKILETPYIDKKPPYAEEIKLLK